MQLRCNARQLAMQPGKAEHMRVRRNYSRERQAGLPVFAGCRLANIRLSTVLLIKNVVEMIKTSYIIVIYILMLMFSNVFFK